MSGVHIHLLINHAPLFGAIFAFVLFVASFIWAPEVLRRTALVVLLCTGVVAAIAYYSGESAQRAIRGFPGVKREIIHDHEELGEISFISSGIAAVIAAVILLRWRRSPLPRGATYVSFLLSAVVTGMMSYTALIGGRVRHTEVRAGATPADAAIVEPPPQPQPKRQASTPTPN